MMDGVNTNKAPKNTLANIGNMAKKNTMLIVLALVIIFFTVGTDGIILNPGNITSLIMQTSYVIVLAVGMLMCILTGGNIDLSVGSVLALVSVIAAKLLVEVKMNVFLVIIIALLLGGLIGAFHGFWIAYIRIPAFIVTLAGMMLWRGLQLVISDAKAIAVTSDKNPLFTSIFNSFIPNIKVTLFGITFDIVCMIISILAAAAIVFLMTRSRATRKSKGFEVASKGIHIFKCVLISAVILFFTFLLSEDRGFPFMLIILAVILVGYSYFTSKTVPGRYLYAVGSNEKAAKMSGVDTNKILFGAYTNMGVLSAVAALICVARFASAQPTAGEGYEMDAIASCFIGGASAYGGTGTVIGALVGALFMGVLNNGMSMMGIDTNAQRVVKGLVLLAAVLFDILSQKRRKALA
ncbi:MAG: sugar ABC transporter permease [Ruminococcus sp.]|jgi:putative multiple sugar transport system permease protein|nr:sugar ABC transporter permease [Ruminococcus sp.]